MNNSDRGSEGLPPLATTGGFEISGTCAGVLFRMSQIELVRVPPERSAGD